MNAAEIKRIADEYADEYEFVGIRTQDHAFAIGSVAHLSHDWYDGDDSGNELDGICASSTRHMSDVERHLRYYIGEHVALVAGNYASYGANPDEPAEIIIRDAVVVAIIK